MEGVTYKKLPTHVAIIMDGNGRWAKKKGLPRTEGHRVGANRVKEIINTCLDLGIKYLTVYAFSKENWKRPRREIQSIMQLSEFFFRREFNKLKKKGVYFVHLGDRQGLTPSLVNILDSMEKNNTQEKRLFFIIAFNYSGRNEIVAALKEIARRVQSGQIDPAELREQDIGQYLYTHGIPDPDLLIRTGGEMRVSNFLLWQIAYTEIWVTDVLWPDFTGELFRRAIEDFMSRERRFGDVISQL
jgi:undecaprenyl diphosphate synthase